MNEKKCQVMIELTFLRDISRKYNVCLVLHTL